MRIEYDPRFDLLYVHLIEPASEVRTETIAPGVHLDFDTSDRLVGIEILDASHASGGEPQFDLALTLSR